MKTTGLRPSILPLPIRLIPPEKNGDYAFLLHLLKSLKPSGKGAIILPHGVLFRGNAEARIRTELLNLDLIKGIIGLPANRAGLSGNGAKACWTRSNPAA